MKKEIVIIITLFLLSGVNLWLNLRPDEKQIEDPNIELFKYKFETIQNRIDSIYNQVNLKDTLIHENSILIHNAPRSKRDSIRAVINPR
jgi:hypothetical protein